MQPKPITANSIAALQRAAAALLRGELKTVRYLVAGGGEPELAVEAGAVHGVGHGVELELSGARVVIWWAMDGLIEGLGLEVQMPPGIREPDSLIARVAVGDEPRWWQVVGTSIAEIWASWHVPNEETPRALWALRLRFGTGRNVVIGLGEVEGGLLKYQPDNLLVIFDDEITDRYIRDAPISAQVSGWELVAMKSGSSASPRRE